MTPMSPSKIFFVFATIAACISSVLSLAIVVPLYSYPDDGCTAWTDFITAYETPPFQLSRTLTDFCVPSVSATDNPSLPFIFIINPNSGPGDPDSQPDANYQSCVPQLRPSVNPNIIVIGYVATGYGQDDPSSVDSQINTYGGWEALYRPSGIFLDEGPTDPSLVSLYQGYADTIRGIDGFDYVSMALSFFQLSLTSPGSDQSWNRH